MAVDITRYDSSMRDVWDKFVTSSKNGTFLFQRAYMDYHADRFEDCSLMFHMKGRLTAILPANINREKKSLISHEGLTYGGIIMGCDTKATEIMEIMAALKTYMKDVLGIGRLLYKSIPYIYAKSPSEEPLYALFREGASIAARSISTTIDNSNRLKLSQQRRRGIAKASKAGISCSRSHDYDRFWEILNNVLDERHGCRPVHTIEEMEMLSKRFPENIKLYTARRGDTMIAGTVIYETETTAHLQYIAASDEGCSAGALDILIAYLTENVYADKRYIDFGISTEQGGTILNEGLIRQKEGFGGRAVIYDTYELAI